MARRTILNSLAMCGASLMMSLAIIPLSSPAWALPTPQQNYAVKGEAAPNSVDLATREAASGKRLLIDIREVDEWIRTGVPSGAKLLSMSDFDFDEELAKMTLGDKTKPLALLCQTGLRAERLRKRLTAAGFTNVRIIAGGLIGNGKNAGWIAAKLPVIPYRDAQ